MEAKKWIEILKDRDPAEIVCIQMWVTDDVIQRADEMDENISKKEAQKILEAVENSIDCNYGITWENIDSGIRDLIKSKGKKAS
jgi:hypothetical protein